MARDSGIRIRAKTVQVNDLKSKNTIPLSGKACPELAEGKRGIRDRWLSASRGCRNGRAVKSETGHLTFAALSRPREFISTDTRSE